MLRSGCVLTPGSLLPTIKNFWGFHCGNDIPARNSIMPCRSSPSTFCSFRLGGRLGGSVAGCHSKLVCTPSSSRSPVRPSHRASAASSSRSRSIPVVAAIGSALSPCSLCTCCARAVAAYPLPPLLLPLPPAAPLHWPAAAASHSSAWRHSITFGLFGSFQLDGSSSLYSEGHHTLFIKQNCPSTHGDPPGQLNVVFGISLSSVFTS